ncbi:helix-hairpin-helix domain-containing protein [Burkholderia multivorans]|uniref:ComEA family DNA-binding protein n=1 Tax=Burkholderia multivorans TaxID=87883 RepID=UPI000D359198|nr:helix-hairpin-helix domain-containing protein [Burkholderia multivorans]MBR8018166.1 helix-hairpin-helix domain-containing protein [Burkholderia multivorans]MEB2511018.1 helix-hairpin-helix domain-containing protein [Burkholderia multivorans]MEB2520469.1 helix-hairpin-helix domain-containing protein [Burkholderia multivorans]MEB2573266.1 helix-hairpin-helix domain-containing protein [Burkholderia multivorans]MEB2590779.1 helix-hairpin-helix domain-containing protein [Burkholderia multivoran
MLKKLLMLFVALSLSLAAGLAAAVDVNTADQAALESVKGLGPVKSKAIIDERTKNGPFKDADDLATRVKGLGTKSVGHLEENGLTIGGSSAPPKGVKLSKPAATTSATTSTTTSAGTASTSTTATAGTTAAAPAPAASTPAAATKPAKSKRASKKDKAAAAAAASADAGASASAPAAASSTKAAKGSKKKSKKDKAASAAAASGA